MNSQNWGVFGIAVMVIGLIGVYALLYPNTQAGNLAIGALLPIAGAVGTYFFHTSSQGFLGSQLAAQRADYLDALSPQGATSRPAVPPTPNASTGSAPAATPFPTPTTNLSNPPGGPQL